MDYGHCAKQWVLGLLVTGLAPVTAAGADEPGTGLFASAGLAGKTVEYEIANRTNTQRFLGLGAKLGVTVGNAYIAANFENTLTGDDEVGERGAVISASREDMDVAVGYALGRGTTVFVGVKNGETNLQQVASADVGADPDNENGAWYFMERGPFVGVNYQWPLNDKNSLSASLAYAQLDYTAELEATTTGGARVEAFTGKAQGFSYGVGWNRAVNQNTVFNIDLKLTRYDVDYDYSTTWGALADTSETYKSIGFSVLTFF